MDLNIYEHIGIMRKGMRAIGRSSEEIEEACRDVTSSNSYEEAKLKIKKYWR
jgi:hypothetical protein